MKQIFRLFILTAVALAYNASARIDLLWEIPTTRIPNFVMPNRGASLYIGGTDGSLAVELNDDNGTTRIAWFDGTGNIVSIIDLSTLRMPPEDPFSNIEDLLFTSSTTLIANIEPQTELTEVVVFTKTTHGLKYEAFSYSGQPNFTGNDNALIRFEGGKLKRYRFVDDQPVLGSIGTNDRYLLLDYAVAPKQKYYLGISKDLKTWEPLYDFTPASGELKIELPKIILGDHSFLKLE
jgi:hypothetical protein